jgi:hypothetical protein
VRPPKSSRFHVITLLRQPWQRPCVPSGIRWRPCSNTKQDNHLCFSLRVFASSRLRVRPTACKPPPRSGNLQAASRRGQISGWKARATCIRVHSCPFVVHRHPCVSFASSRLRVRPTACKPPSSQRQSAGSQLQRADLGLESPSYLHSRSFVVHSASGGVSPLVTALTSVLWLQPQRRAAPSPSGETELSRHPRHATAVDGDSDLPLPHTRDATTPLCSTAYDDN